MRVLHQGWPVRLELWITTTIPELKFTPAPSLFAGNTWILKFQDPHSLGWVVFSDVRSLCQKVGQNGFSTLAGAPKEDSGLQQLSPGPTQAPLESAAVCAERKSSHYNLPFLPIIFLYSLNSLRLYFCTRSSFTFFPPLMHTEIISHIIYSDFFLYFQYNPFKW